MIFLTSLFIFFAFPGSGRKLQTVQFNNGSLLKVEIARTEEEKARGLMDKTHLAEDQGMLFVFKKPKKLFFWTKKTYIPLSIGYFDKDRVLKEVHFMKPQNMMERDPKINTYSSSCQCQYAIEVNRGWFRKNKIKPGDWFSIKKPKKKN